MSNRIIKSLSFSKDDPHEIELHNFAVEQDKYFGRYIKRLIDRDKREKERGKTGFNTAPGPTPNAVQEDEVDSKAASGFL